jgi:hypothetical protein
MYVFLICSLLGACPNHFILLDLSIQVILGKTYRLGSALCNFLLPPITYCLLGLSILRTCFLNILTASIYRRVIHEGSQHTKLQAEV